MLPSCPALANLWALLVSPLSPGSVSLSSSFSPVNPEPSQALSPGTCSQASGGSCHNQIFAKGLLVNPPPAYPWPFPLERSAWLPKTRVTGRWGLQWGVFQVLRQVGRATISEYVCRGVIRCHQLLQGILKRCRGKRWALESDLSSNSDCHLLAG